eukprot:3478749-Pleurochrysis_carterae.AAC.1
MGRQQGPDKRSAIARVKEAEESRERLKQLLATLRVVKSERAEVSSVLQAEMFGTSVNLLCTTRLHALQELAVLDRQLALNAEMKEKEESLTQEVPPRGCVCVQERLAGSMQAGRFKGDVAVKGKGGRGGGSKVGSADRSAAEYGEGCVNGGGRALRAARRTRGACMDVHQSEEAAGRRVALRDEVSAAQVAQSAASQEWFMARDASHRAHAKVAETKSKMEPAMDALAQAQAELKAGE